MGRGVEHFPSVRPVRKLSDRRSTRESDSADWEVEGAGTLLGSSCMYSHDIVKV